ncbi:Uncharacterized protein FWK35_00038527 [Aphis craccivora]|uniref:Uncharacterized protein n=1 Tax=Aphis craccivora TaxID=307492 RepID=A0A6G0VU61_APHCR|nr:Uncharacterized protein FWK35_00038527 [Aphis craccivora]
MAEDEERLRRLTRLLKWNTLKRAIVVSQIRNIHDVALRVDTDNSLALLYSFYVADLDSLWHEFKSFDLAVLNCLFELNRADEYSLDLHPAMCKLVEVSKTVWTQICHMDAERIINKALPTTCESIPQTSKTVRSQCTISPSGRFSEVLPTRPSASDIPSVVPRPTVTLSLNRDYDMSDCNLLTLKSPLAKLVSTLGPVIRSPNFVRPCIYDLVRNGPLPPDIIRTICAASGAHKWSLNFVKGPVVIKRVVAPPPPPAFPLHPVIYRQPTMCVRNPERYRVAYPSLSVHYLPARRRLRYVRSPSSLHQWADVTSIMVWVIGLHKSIKNYMFNCGYHIHTLLMTVFFGQYIKSSNRPADRALHGIMPIIPARLLLYWCDTHGANGDPSELDDSSPSLSLCGLSKFLSSCITRIVDMTNQLSTRTCNIDHMLHTVIHMRRKSATRGRRNCDLSVLVVISGDWVSYLPPSNLFLYVVFDGGSRLRRLVRSKGERTISVTSISCVSQHIGRRLHRLVCHANPCVSTTTRSASSSRQGVDPLAMYELRLIIIVHRKLMSGVICPWWHYYPPII